MFDDQAEDHAFLRWCCIDDCPARSVVVIESYPDDVGLCAEHRPVHGELEPWERERRVQ